jgi:hypothetical protein
MYTALAISRCQHAVMQAVCSNLQAWSGMLCLWQLYGEVFTGNNPSNVTHTNMPASKSHTHQRVECASIQTHFNENQCSTPCPIVALAVEVDHTICNQNQKTLHTAQGQVNPSDAQQTHTQFNTQVPPQRSTSATPAYNRPGPGPCTSIRHSLPARTQRSDAKQASALNVSSTAHHMAKCPYGKFLWSTSRLGTKCPVIPCIAQRSLPCVNVRVRQHVTEVPQCQ